MKTRRLIPPALLPTMLLLLAPQSLRAGNATWSLNPASGDWNTAANWTPNTVPNGPSDIATFASSYDPNVSINTSVEVDSIVFDSSAPNFTITIGTAILSITGAGIISDTAAYQYFIGGEQRGIFFYNSATVANSTFFVANGGVFSFNDSSSAGHGNFLINTVGPYQAFLEFSDNSTAAEATITASNGFVSFSGGTGGNAVITAVNGGSVDFDSSADHAVVTCSSAPGIIGSGIFFGSTGTGAQGSFTAEGAARSGDSPAYITLADIASGGDGGFVVNGGSVQGASGAVMTFFENSTAANATLTANGGVNGGEGGAILFVDGARGGMASISLLGNGELDIGNSRATAGVAIGSLAGDGLVFLGPKTLTIGSNNQSTTFFGVIQDGGDNQGTGGSLTKIGTGTLTLSGANTYTGATAVTAGVLKVGNKTGSATGTGAVDVNAGTLGGGGIISGAVTVGTGGGAGAFLAPATGTNKQAALTTQSGLTFNSGATYTYTFKAKGKKARTDQVIANGVTINGASFAFQGTAQGTLKTGLTLTAISNTAATPIVGTFANLPDGAILTVNGNNFQASYEGGDGNDLTLTVVP